MSGGFFDYNQFRIRDIHDTIERCLSRMGKEKPEDELFDTKEYYEKYKIVPIYKKGNLPNVDSIAGDDDDEIHVDNFENIPEFKKLKEKGFWHINKDELDDIKIDLDKMRSNFPTHPESSVDINGQAALGADSKALTLVWSKPLGDPLGGTELANGRHQIKMFEQGDIIKKTIQYC